MKKIAECRQEEDWALYALGALDPDDAAQMRAHLRHAAKTACRVTGTR